MSKASFVHEQKVPSLFKDATPGQGTFQPLKTPSYKRVGCDPGVNLFVLPGHTEASWFLFHSLMYYSSLTRSERVACDISEKNCRPLQDSV